MWCVFLHFPPPFCWGEALVDLSRPLQTDRDIDTIRLDEENTVKSLRDQLMNLVSVEEDGGFPILREDDGGLRMLGYIGANELEHALSIVAEEADAVVTFHTTSAYGHHTYSSIYSLPEEEAVNGTPGNDPFDFSIYMDKAPLTVQDNSPLELLQEFFTKLGARYVVVTDSDGHCGFKKIIFPSVILSRCSADFLSLSAPVDEGVIDKKAWLAFLRTLGEKH